MFIPIVMMVWAIVMSYLNGGSPVWDFLFGAMFGLWTALLATEIRDRYL